MDKLRELSRTVDGISVVIALVLQEIVVDAVLPSGTSPTIYRLLSIPLVIYAIHVLRSLSMQLISRSEFILSRFLREDFIEGIWIGLSPQDTALVNIAICGHDIRVSGQLFDRNLNPVMEWRTLSAVYDRGELRYWYTSTLGPRDKPQEAQGYCTLQFLRNDPHAAPHAYRGELVDLSGPYKRLRFRSEKITDKTHLKKLRVGGDDGAREVIWQVIATAAEHSG